MEMDGGFAMRRMIVWLCISVLCMACLSGCQATDTQTRAQDTVSSETTQATDVTAQTTDASLSTAAKTQRVPHVLPYTFSPGMSLAIYTGPGFIYDSAQATFSVASYTVVEETQDTQGNLWGKLDADAGWISLTQVAQQTPVTLCFADDATMRDGEPYQEYMVDDTQYTVEICFYANETLRDVEFVMLQPNETSYTETEKLYKTDTVPAQSSLVLGIVFWGDMTTYGISFTDADGNIRHYAIYTSGKDGALLLAPYEP